jgi:hypothetical protein
MPSRLISRGITALLSCLVLVAGVAAQPRAGDAPAPATKAFAALVGDAAPIGKGPLVAWRTKDQTLLAIPVDLLDRLYFWYVEAARFPEAALAKDGNSVAEAVVQLERQGSRLLVRDRSPSFLKRSPSGVPEGDATEIDPRLPLDPIDIAIDTAALGPVILALPILAEADGRILVDLTAAFSSDIDGLTAAKHIASAGVVPAPIGLTTDPARSYIADIDVYPDNLHIRSHLTFRAQNPGEPFKGFQPISIELGHSLVLLPDKPMAARRYDDRVGYMFVDFSEFETSRGEAASDPLRGVIKRFRLEKADPTAAVSDPVRPIVFYIGQGVPERWRRWIAAGVESWEPAFRKAGFSNAIKARNAPSPADDPDWSPDDARYNVIRWVPQPFENAMGPSVADPRSGEILFAHVLLWPQVLGFFSDYYWLMAHGIDPEIDGLPLNEAAQGKLLQYIVAHEVGHSIGLRHNHLASTAYTVSELRDPAFADASGPNASIMAYGRMNQAAQPGDGVTRVLAGHGPYDDFAIQWGYGIHGRTPAEEQAALGRMAAASVDDRLIRWAAGEAGFEERWMFDPRVQMEAVGSERIDATRLGLAKLATSMAALDGATSDERIFRSVYALGLSQFDMQMNSVLKMVGGHYATGGDGRRPLVVPAAEQRAAVAFLVGEGAAAYDVFLQPSLVRRGEPIAGDRVVDAHRTLWLGMLLSGSRLALVQGQHAIDPSAYGVAAMARDITDAVWGDLEGMPAWRASQQRAYLDALAKLFDPPANPNLAAVAAGLAAQMHTQGYIAQQLATGADTLFPAYAREALPAIKLRLERAAKAERDESRRLHLRQMAERIGAMLEA